MHACVCVCDCIFSMRVCMRSACACIRTPTECMRTYKTLCVSNLPPPPPTHTHTSSSPSLRLFFPPSLSTILSLCVSIAFPLHGVWCRCAGATRRSIEGEIPHRRAQEEDAAGFIHIYIHTFNIHAYTFAFSTHTHTHICVGSFLT
jgi:hypothetical protein